MVVEAQDGVEEDAGGEDSAQKASSAGKPNIAILGVAAVIGLVMLGVVGMFVKDKLAPSAASDQRETLVEAPISMDAPVSVFKQAPTDAAANIFDKPPGNQQGAFPVDVAAPAPALEEAVASVQPPEPVSAPVAPVAEAFQPIELVKPAPAVVAECKPVEQASQCDNGSVKSSQVAGANSKAKTAAKPKRAVARTAKAHSHARQAIVWGKSKSRSAVQPEVVAKSVETAQPVEVFLLPRGVRVHSVFPQSGPNVQAWLAVKGGGTEIVRVGEKLRSGAMVTAIYADKDEVVTSSGTITSSGVR